MSGDRRLLWLALTPEPERELPSVMARLRGDPSPEAERRRIERLVLRGTQRAWLGYLGGIAAEVRAAAADPGTDVTAALTAAEVVLEHHRMLIGLPGRGYEAAAGAREELERASAELRARADADADAETGSGA